MKSEKNDINKLLTALRKSAQGNYNTKLETSSDDKDMDDVYKEINTLINNLKINNVRQEYVEYRINHITGILNQVANGVYTESCVLSPENDIFDALGIGVNMMIDDILLSNEKIEDQRNKLEKRNRENESLYKEYKNLSEDLRKAKDRAEESDRLKSAFLANMSHEIRTPMNGVLGFANLLKNQSLSVDDQKDYISLIEKSGARMLNIIDDIVNISRIESGTERLNLQAIDIYKEQEILYAFFKPEVDAKNLAFSFNSSRFPGDSFIRTDKIKFISILSNLIKNAIKYTLEGSIEFGYSQVDKNLKFYVKDTGIGVDKERQEAIFERFIQADIIDKMAREGAGLGLSISKAYVEMLGGELWLESEKDRGSTFYFTIPVIEKS